MTIDFSSLNALVASLIWLGAGFDRSYGASQHVVLDEVESRLQAIYERGEFRAKCLSGEWFSDSSGYSLRERDGDGGETVRARNDVSNGQRTILKSSDFPNRDNGDHVSSDGKRFVYMAYPEHNHGLCEGKGTSVHLPSLMTRYLLDYLLAGPQYNQKHS